MDLLKLNERDPNIGGIYMTDKEEKPEFNRDELVKKLEDLQNKESWIRKNLKEFLEMWAEITGELGNDPKVKYHRVVKTTPRDNYGHSYALKKGADYIVKRRNPDRLDNYSKKKIKWIDMGIIHKIVDSLPEELERYYKRLEERDEKYVEAQEKLENLLRYKP